MLTKLRMSLFLLENWKEKAAQAPLSALAWSQGLGRMSQLSSVAIA